MPGYKRTFIVLVGYDWARFRPNESWNATFGGRFQAQWAAIWPKRDSPRRLCSIQERSLRRETGKEPESHPTKPTISIEQQFLSVQI